MSDVVIVLFGETCQDYLILLGVEAAQSKSSKRFQGRWLGKTNAATLRQA